MSIFEVTPQNAMLWSRMNSRVAFGAAMYDIAKHDERVLVLTADVAASSGLERLRDEMPGRVISCGIAEQNMICMAAGLASEGYRVFAVSFAPFASMRCFEPIRQYVGYMKANVCVVGIASGLSMGVGGNTHYGLEDIALMRTVPGMTVLSPADCTETVLMTEAAASFTGPTYLRLTGVGGNPIVYKAPYELEIGRAIVLREGTDAALIGTGAMVNECVRASRALEKAGVSTAVVDMHTIKPLDTDTLSPFMNAKLIVTAEEHSVIGGLGDAAAAYLAAIKNAPPLLKIGVGDTFLHAGDYPYMLEQTGLNARAIADKILNIL